MTETLPQPVIYITKVTIASIVIHQVQTFVVLVSIKKGEPAIKKDVFDEYLTGCPLDEKISEMNWLMAHGSPLAALIVVMIDNPMVPATGHRICNECMRSCIYQKQDPVNIPKIESFVLDQVIALPWGVEIYDLLCRWHPLRIKQWILQPPNHTHVFIMGMGPAGFSMAHHLLMMGCDVFGADGLSIDELPQAWIDGQLKLIKLSMKMVKKDNTMDLVA